MNLSRNNHRNVVRTATSTLHKINWNGRTRGHIFYFRYLSVAGHVALRQFSKPHTFLSVAVLVPPISDNKVLSLSRYG